jgi:hypothetical protein
LAILHGTESARPAPCTAGEAAAGIIWLASYPRSGNTWLRFLLCAYLLGAVRGSHEMEGRIPNLHRGHLDQARDHDPKLVKTHRPWGQRHPCHNESRACIYLIRHPKDVLLSNLNYFKLQGQAVEDRAFALDFIDNGGLAWWRTELGTWEEHARSWIEAPALSRLVIRYEAMRAEPHTSLARVVRFLGLEPHPERIERAVRDCELSRLRRLEVEERQARAGELFPGGFETLAQDRCFFHRGGVGQDLSHIGHDLDRLFDDRFAGSLALLRDAESR